MTGISSKKIEFMAVSAFIALFLFLASRDIALPGLNSNEAYTACGALGFLKKAPTYDAVSSTIRGRHFPLLFVTYHASLGSYLLAPFLLIFGINTIALRIAPIFFGALTMFFSYLFTRSLFNKQAGFIVLLLLATSPFFIISSKIGNYVHSYASFFATLSLFLLYKWYCNKKIQYFFAAMFTLGLGVSTVSWFIVYVFTLMCLFFFFRDTIGAAIAGYRSRFLYALGGITFFTLGAFLFIYPNLFYASSRFVTFKVIYRQFFKTQFNINNTNVITNICLRFKTFIDFLRENDLFFSFVPYAERIANDFGPYFFALAFFWLCFALLCPRKTYFEKRKIFFVLLVPCFVLFLSSFTVAGFFSRHLLVLVPCVQIILSIGIIEFLYFFHQRAYAAVIVATILVVTVISNVFILNYDSRMLRKVGGAGEWSDSVYALADWLKKTHPKNIAMFNGVSARNIYFLLQGNKFVVDSMAYPIRDKDLFSFLHEKDTVYLFNLPVVRMDTQRLYKTIENAGRRLVTLQTFYQRDGIPAYVAYNAQEIKTMR